MAESQIIERSPTATVIRTGGNGQKLTIPNTLPILPIRNIVVFPGTVIPLNVGRQKSKNLLDEVMPAEKLIGVVSQRNAESEFAEDERGRISKMRATITTVRVSNATVFELVAHGPRPDVDTRVVVAHFATEAEALDRVSLLHVFWRAKYLRSQRQGRSRFTPCQN